MNIQIISSGLPNLFNIEFRRWWEEKCRQGYEPEEIFPQDYWDDYIIPAEFCALSVCYFNTMIDKSIPSFETLQNHFSTWIELEQVLKVSAADKNRIEKFLKNHISKIGKLYYSEDSKWQRLTKSIKAEIKVNDYVKNLLELFGEKNLPLRGVILFPAFFSRPGLFKITTLEKTDFESLRRFLKKDYNRKDIEVVCPPVYYSKSKLILIPLHESGSIAGNPLIFDLTLAHEVSHAITCWLIPMRMRYSPKGIKPEMDSLSYDEVEVMTDILAVKILEKYKKCPPYVISFLKTLDWNNIFEKFRKFIHFIAKEKQLFSQQKSLAELPIKRLKGILEKKMGYQRLVKGLDKSQLIKLIEKKISKQEGKILGQIRGFILDIKKEMRLIDAAKVLHKAAGTFFNDSRMVKFYKEILDEM